MSALFKTLGVFGPVSALLLAALLAAGALADHVTTERCKPYHTSARIREHPTDSNATHLWLSGCYYSNVNPNDWTGLTNVKNIYLYRNDIVSIHPDTFRSVPGLKMVELSRNMLREFPVLTEHSCRNVTVFFLRFNLITGLRSARIFAACTNLQRLYLDGNHIAYVHPEAFSALKELTELYLQGNKIKIISNQMFENNHKLFELGLHRNSITHLPLDFAGNLKRAGVMLHNFYFYSNPWNCACLLEALSDAKRAGVRVYNNAYDTNIIHYDGTRAECVYIGAIPCIRQPGLLRPPPNPVHGV